VGSEDEDLILLAQEGYCQNGNKNQVLDQLSDYQVLNKDSASWS
jgi:hypothetical protein